MTATFRQSILDEFARARGQFASRAARDLAWGWASTREGALLLAPFDFELWAVTLLGGRPSKHTRHDFGVDGVVNGRPVQVKKTVVSRNHIDAFEAVLLRTVPRYGVIQGTIVGLRFSQGAQDEAMQVRKEQDFRIETLTLDRLIANVTLDRDREEHRTVYVQCGAVNVYGQRCSRLVPEHVAVCWQHEEVA